MRIVALKAAYRHDGTHSQNAGERALLLNRAQKKPYGV